MSWTSCQDDYGELNKWYMPGYDEVYVEFDVMFEEGFENLRSDGAAMHLPGAPKTQTCGSITCGSGGRARPDLPAPGRAASPVAGRSRDVVPEFPLAGGAESGPTRVPARAARAVAPLQHMPGGALVPAFRSSLRPAPRLVFLGHSLAP